MSSEPRNITVRDTAGTLAVADHLLGFRPRESLVLLLLSGTGVEAALRVDLPRPGASDFARWALAQRVADYAGTDGAATGALMIVYSGDLDAAPGGGGGPCPPFDPAAALPHAALVGATAALLGRRGIGVPEALLVGARRWRSYLCTDPCCPAEGTPLDGVALSEANLEFVLAGSSPVDVPWDGSTPAVWPGRAAVREAVRLRAGLVAGAGPLADAVRPWFRVLAEPPASALDRLRGDPVGCGRLLAALHHPPVVRLVAYCAADGPARAEAALRGGGAIAVARLTGSSADRPDWERIGRLWELGRGLLAAAEGPDRDALLVLLAWVEWARGRGTAADALLAAAGAAPPDPAGLAGALRLGLDHGLLPVWARSPRTAWRGSPDGAGAPGRAAPGRKA